MVNSDPMHLVEHNRVLHSQWLLLLNEAQLAGPITAMGAWMWNLHSCAGAKCWWAEFAASLRVYRFLLWSVIAALQFNVLSCFHHLLLTLSLSLIYVPVICFFFKVLFQEKLPCSALAARTNGGEVSMPGLLFQPLLRHGNHAMRQSPVKGQVVVQQDMEWLVLCERSLAFLHISYFLHISFIFPCRLSSARGSARFDFVWRCCCSPRHAAAQEAILEGSLILDLPESAEKEALEKDYCCAIPGSCQDRRWISILGQHRSPCHTGTGGISQNILFASRLEKLLHTTGIYHC